MPKHPIESLSPVLLGMISANQAHTLRVLPASKESSEAIFYTDCTPPLQPEMLRMLLGCVISYEIVESPTFDKYLYTYYPQSNQQKTGEVSSTPTLAHESDIVRFVDKVLQDAADMGASDIHIERYERKCRIRFRWEGQLVEKYDLAATKYNAIVSRLKIMADIDISERRLPQDGRIHFQAQGKDIDVRVSTIPVKFGEKIVMRLLNRSIEFLQLNRLGMSPSLLQAYQRAIRQPNGIVLITGPTGSGKTTTLYATLNLLNTVKKNIITIEDPIEYNMEGINQAQVKEEIGLTFGELLRAYLRQDPDIIMIGEIRDSETAEIAVRAALAGRLVFSTLHANYAVDTMVRLVDMGVAPYLLAASMRMIVAQRLIRVLCDACKQPSTEVIDAALQHHHNIHEHYVPTGCAACNYTGYTHRKAIYESIVLDDEVGSWIRSRELTRERYYARFPNAPTLGSEARALVLSGNTSVEEAYPYLL